ncbi:MAG: hypothetical protein UT82_C0009G0034 [Parcubacteria group bacterium GW2011_GWB1_40_14]|nr:MAG: hypothetical protein UT82_C0009G0034 [Parcubacteria group bacterium GW2011_GWB1_40_14]
MKIKSFLRAFLDGLASIGEGMASLSLFSSSHLPNYEERFGTDAELLASDWRKVVNDLSNASKSFEYEKKPKKDG